MSQPAFIDMPRAMLRVVAVTLFGSLFSSAALSQDFPTRPINIVVPYAAGGSSDVVARLFAQKLGEQFGQAVVVLNKPGAGATIGTGFAAQRGQLGYTALLADNAQTVAPALYTKLTYDSVNDFRVAGFIGQATTLLLASKASGLQSVQDVKDRAAKNPGSTTIGTGNGSPSHLISELFQMKSKARLQVVPYKGASAALADLLAGHIDLVFTNPASASQYLDSGKLTVLGQTGEQRDARFPNVPTFKESGIEDLNVAYWFAMLLPSDTPPDVQARWRKEMAAALASPEVKTKLDSLGISQIAMSPEAAQNLIHDEAALWSKVSDAAGLRVQ